MKERSHKRMQRALDAIEASLGGSIDLACIAQASHLSPYHFARLFRATFNDSVMSYVRKRRLSHAVQLLATGGDSILDIALACGFASNEAFTRAFRKQFDISPTTYRRNAQHFHLPLQRKLIMRENPKAESLNVTFRQRAALLAIGCAGEFAPGATSDIGQLWSRFAPRIAEVPNQLGTATYGICCLPEEGPRDPDRFTYVAAVEVTSLDDIPEGMIGVTLPAHEYAVFAYDGGIGPNLPRMVQTIFGEWLPNSEFEQDGADFEYYDDAFDPHTGMGTFYIYVPIKPRIAGRPHRVSKEGV